MSKVFRDLKSPLVQIATKTEASAVNLENAKLENADLEGGRVYSSLETYIRFQLGGSRFAFRLKAFEVLQELRD